MTPLKQLPLLTASQAVQVFGHSLPTIQRMARQGTLDAYKDEGGRWVIRNTKTRP